MSVLKLIGSAQAWIGFWTGSESKCSTDKNTWVSVSVGVRVRVTVNVSVRVTVRIGVSVRVRMKGQH